MTSLRHGERGQAVRQLQRQLNQASAALFVDGHFGDATETALRRFQARAGLVTDGIAGPKTLAALAGTGAANPLRQSNLVSAAKHLGVELAAIMAVNEVESLGQGFDATGKPKILFERHVMYRQLSTPRHAGDDAAALKAHAVQLAVSYPALVNPRPGGYAGGTAEHQRLANARLLDALCADESASWGAFQIMGYHWQRLGYASIDAFVACMSHSEAEQLAAFVGFIETDPALHKALKGKKWAQFAKLYNGPAYARNLYDVKLERAYQRHATAISQQVAA